MASQSAGGSQFPRIRNGILGLGYSGGLRGVATRKRHNLARAAEPCPFILCLPHSCLPCREGQGPLEILQLDFEMENFTSQSVKRRIMWHIDYRGHSALPDLERVVTELTVIQRDVQAILPLAMVSRPRPSTPARSMSSHVCSGTGQGCARVHVDGGKKDHFTSETMPVELGMCPPTGGKHSSVPGEITIEERSEKGLLRGALLESGCPREVLEVIRKEALIPSKMKRRACSGWTQLL